MNHDNRVVFSTEYFQIEEVAFHSAAETNPYYRLTGSDSAIACLFDSRSRVLLVKQFRQSLGEYTLEFPAGAIDPGEDSLSAARREVLEETGFEVDIAPIGHHYHLLTNRTNIKMYLFCGRISEVAPPLNPESGMELVWLSRSELREASLDGRFKQLGGLGLLQVLSGVIGVNIWDCPDTKLQAKLDGLLSRDTNEVE